MEIKQAINILNKIEQDICNNEQFLSELDAAIGDGDHGHNMAKGMKAVSNVINNKTYSDFTALFKDVAMQLISNVGGASGPLYGTAFMEMAKAAENKTILQESDLVELLQAAIAGIQKRGKADINEKTMLDVLIPTTNFLQDHSLEDTLKQIPQFLSQTKDMQATKGRASYLQERSIGHIDPGAKSMAIMLTDLLEAMV